MCAEFSDSFLSASSSRVVDGRAWIEGHFDLGFFASSWDRRCISVVESENLTLQTSVLLLFDHRDGLGLRSKHDPLMEKFLAGHSAEVVSITGSSVDTDSIWDGLSHELLRVAAGHRRPLEIYLDLSTFPRFYALGLIALCVRSGLIAKMVVGYAEGSYPERSQKLSVVESYPFTSGRWTTMSIPFLSGSLEPSLSKFYFVSPGFEGSKTMRVVMREDPDRISLLFPRPGFRPEYENLAAEANQELIDRRRVPPEQIVDAPAGDAVAAWSAISSANLERFDRENVYYLCCGTKPHSLAFALRALVRDRAVVMYNVPERYNPIDVVSSGVFWRYEIFDATAI